MSQDAGHPRRRQAPQFFILDGDPLQRVRCLSEAWANFLSRLILSSLYSGPRIFLPSHYSLTGRYYAFPELDICPADHNHSDRAPRFFPANGNGPRCTICMQRVSRILCEFGKSETQKDCTSIPYPSPLPAANWE